MGTFRVNGKLSTSDEISVNGALLLTTGGQINTKLNLEETGGFARGHSYTINGTDLGGFGFYGGASKINYFYVAKDFIAPWMKVEPNGTVTATKFVGSLQGNADTASKLATARTISLTGSVTGSGSFDGSGNLNITTTTNHTHSWSNITSKPSSFTPSSHTHDYLPLSGGILSARLTINSSDNNVSPGAQNIILNGVSGSTDTAKSPGIGFHIGNVVWSSLKMYPDGTFRFLNESCTNYRDVYAKAFVAVGNGKTFSVSSGNTSYTHYRTNADNGHWFNSNIYAQGNIYAGSNYSDLVLTSANYTSYAPSKTGSGASGTWPINITGNANSASKVYGYYTGNGGRLAPSDIGRQNVKFHMMNGFMSGQNLGYMDCMLMNTYGGGDVPYCSGLGIVRSTGDMYIAWGSDTASEWSGVYAVWTAKHMRVATGSLPSTGTTGDVIFFY